MADLVLDVFFVPAADDLSDVEDLQAVQLAVQLATAEVHSPELSLS
jgi:hypothetical protein